MPVPAPEWGTGRATTTNQNIKEALPAESKCAGGCAPFENCRGVLQQSSLWMERPVLLVLFPRGLFCRSRVLFDCLVASSVSDARNI
jgi:hypothetical protein